MSWLEWLPLLVALAALGTVLGAATGAMVTPRALRALADVPPGARAGLLVALIGAPASMALGVVALAFLPSALDGLGLVADHCAHHGAHHDFHLCFLHGHPPTTSPAALVAGAGLLGWLILGWARELARLRHARRWRARLAPLAHRDEELGALRLQSERALAITTGLLRPTIWISSGLLDVLDQAQLRAVLAHERAHARRRDSLIKLLARLGTRLHLPRTRARLLEALELACERACDEAAAQATGDRLVVAEALLVLQRARQHRGAPAPAVSFGDHALQARVRAMLEEPEPERSWSGPIGLGLGALGLGLLATRDASHHLLESLLAWLF